MDADGHLSTCYDIAKISSYAMKDKNGLFRSIVRCKEFSCRPRGAHVRNVVWKNTNKLLFQDRSVIGLKTGVTRKAGPCLCSCTLLSNSVELFVITLHSSSRQCRWHEHSAMYRFARKNLGISKAPRGLNHGATERQSKLIEMHKHSHSLLVNYLL